MTRCSFKVLLVVTIRFLISSDISAQDANPCENVTCSGHGTCVIKGGDPVCACYDGYIPNATTGLSCQPLGMMGTSHSAVEPLLQREDSPSTTEETETARAAAAPSPVDKCVWIFLLPDAGDDLYLSIIASDGETYSCELPCGLSLPAGMATVEIKGDAELTTELSGL